MATRSFDLNIEEVLENWEVEHAIREIIANALDEQVITKSADIKITKDPVGSWHIQDAGRGLRIDHVTQGESQHGGDGYGSYSGFILGYQLDRLRPEYKHTRG